MALALLLTVKNTLSGVCLSFHVAGTASIIRAVKTVQSLTIVTEWRINMSKKCVCGNEMFTVFMCRKCEHLLYVEEGLWRLLGRAEGFEGTVFTEESDED